MQTSKTIRCILGTLALLIVFSFAVPVTLHAQETDTSNFFPLIQCGRDGSKGGTIDNIVTEDEQCTFSDLVLTAQRALNGMVFLSVFLAAVVFTYAGFIYVTSAGEQGKIEKAHNIFKNVFIGLMFVLGAWLLVFTITSTLLKDEVETLLEAPGS